MLEVAVPVALAVAGGLATLAFKEPRVFCKMFAKLYIGTTIVFIALNAWTGGITHVSIELMRLIPPEKHDAAQQAVESMSVPFQWVFLGSFAVIAYLFLLQWFAYQVLDAEDSH